MTSTRTNRGRRAALAVVTAALATPLLAISVATGTAAAAVTTPAGAVGKAEAAGAVGEAEAAGAVGAAGEARATVTPCPRMTGATVPHPPKPSPPHADHYQRAIGGSRLDTVGLVLPAGVARPPAITATSWLVADLSTGEVLAGCGPHEYSPPASVQKLLLAATYLAKLDPHRVVTVTPGDLDIPADSSMVGLVPGGRYRIETLWLGLLLQSGNDAANVLARLGGGSVADGVRAMNGEAAWLGAYQTHAVTPSGYDGAGQFTSAYDLALIARACFADEAFRRYAATRSAFMPAQPPKRKRFEIQNQNQLLYDYPGALGGKTGFTDLARHTYVGAAQRGGRRLVVTLLGAESWPQAGWQQGAALLDWAFGLPAGASVGHLVNPGEAPATPAPKASGSSAGLAAAIDAPAAGHGWKTSTVVAVGVLATSGLGLVFGLVRRMRRPRP
ncbi:D-alanyl-D-alanine carboxypeptidase (penicillin-binding protein 5/6) [Hamadaea flava]|uniref:D-alanyl-D-alanine carboxypeptidase family protein n=1 Tax=Hamadaea flava TaxID=1742688 RepID=A0ABV8M2C5_9ACTN|nr:serine hydrolase [Hamadaea flava]MCP2322087.1 D-alanyl-D-alanine carboxypeptidase (penicillin-binding protein 5/6) [Hamadaea flava]